MLLVLIGVVVFLIISNSLGGDVSDPALKSEPLFGEVIDGEVIPYFNTSCIIYDYSGMGDREFSALVEDIESMTRYYHRLFDIYHSYDGVVNLHYVNAHAGEEIEISEELYEFLEFALQMHELTDGEVNIALGSVLSLWHDSRESALLGNAVKLPSEKDISEALLHTDIEDVLLLGGNKIKLADSKMSLDVGAIAKGYAVEKIAAFIESRGVSGIVLDYGGNLRAIGEKPSGNGWKTGIKDPSDQSSYIKKFDIKNTSVVTSGDYERAFVLEGVKYHHIIDGESGYPARGFSSVTVVTKNSALADALSTALFCMDTADRVRASVEKIKAELSVDIFVVLVDSDGNLTDF